MMMATHTCRLDGHQVFFDSFAHGEADTLIAWLDRQGYASVPEPEATMTWPSGREYQVLRAPDGTAIFIRLFDLDPQDAMLLKLAFGGG
jgi:hypothetical protein